MSPQATTAKRQESQDDAEGTRTAWNEIAPGYDETVTPTHLWLGK
jgi:hypothetical protein